MKALPRRERASVGQGAERLSLNVAFLLPLLEVSQSGQFSGILHPLDDLNVLKYILNCVSFSQTGESKIPGAW